MYLTKTLVKNHLNLDNDFTDDDDYIVHLIVSSEEAVAKRLNVKSLSDLIDPHTGGIPESVIHSVLLLIGNLYANREPVAYGTAIQIPYTLEFLFDLHRNYETKF